MASRFLILSVSSLIFFFFLAVSSAQTNPFDGSNKVFDVSNYGAQNDGYRNIFNNPAFLQAWSEACQWSGGRSTVYIPKGTFYLEQIMFVGPCKSPITFTIKGTLLAPEAVPANTRAEWISFRYVDNLTVTGGGVLDGLGYYSWRINDCSTNPDCLPLALNMGFWFVRSSRIHNLSSINSKKEHINLFEVENFNISDVTITVPGDSPNTDGIKIRRSMDMHISNVTIGTGANCIVILDGTVNLNISDVRCGPGYGISVGSLGINKDEQNVEGITVRNSVFNGTTNGVRLSTWAKSPSQTLVSNFLYENIQMINVGNPIVLYQLFCPNYKCESDPNYNSYVQIKNVKYNNISGTSTTQVALNLQCSETFPCQGVELSNIYLVYEGGDGISTSTCENVGGSIRGQIVPGDCRIR